MEIRKKRIITFIVSFFAAVSIMVVVLLVAAFVSNSFYSNNLILSFDFYEDVDNIVGEVQEVSMDYYSEKYDDIITGSNSKGDIFPKTINDGTIEIFDYHKLYTCDSGKVFRNEIYLKWDCTNKDTYLAELERLSYIKSSFDKTLINSNNLFSLPSLVAEYNIDGGFEYVLLDEQEYCFHYVCLKGVGSYSQIVFDTGFAPHKLLKNTDFPKEKIKQGGYSIYVSYINK